MAALALLALAIFAWRWVQPAPAVTPAPTPLLLRHTGRFDFHHVPLHEALDLLAARTRTTIVYGRPGFYSDILDRPVSIGFDDKPLGRAIQLVTASVDPLSSLVLDECDGYLRVCIERPGDARFDTRLYDINPLITPSPATVNPTSYDTSGNGVFVPTDNHRYTAVEVIRRIIADQAIDEICKLITNCAMPGFWPQTGGSEVDVISLHDGTIAIRTTPAGHRHIANLLAHLRSAKRKMDHGLRSTSGGVDVLNRPPSDP